jgi:hypothetical protein
MSLYAGFIQLGAGLSVGLAGMAAGFAVGIVGDAGVRASAQQPRLFTGMVSKSPHDPFTHSWFTHFRVEGGRKSLFFARTRAKLVN